MTLLHRWVPLAVFAAGLAVYLATLNSTVQAADSGEFQLVAAGLGIAHPPGYPLYTLLGWFSMQLTGVFALPPLTGLSALSAVASAAALALLTSSVLTAAHPAYGWRVLLAAIAAAAILATSTTFWAQALTANIRSLTALFAAAMIFCAARASAGRSSLSLFALVFGLGVAHHISLLFPGVILGAYVVAQSWRGTPSPRAVARPLLLVALTQVIWLYLPLRDVPGAPLAPGGLRTLDGFLSHVLARGFGGDMFYFLRVEPERFFDRLALVPTLLSFQFNAVTLSVLFMAALVTLLTRRALAMTLLGAALLHAFVTLMYRAPQTVEYAMPVWVLLGALAGIGLATLPADVDLRQRSVRLLARTIAVAALIGVAVGVRSAFLQLIPSFRVLQADASVAAQARSRLAQAAPGGIILAQWHEATPMWVLQRGLDAVPGASLYNGVTVEYVAPASKPYAETFAERAAALHDADPARGVYVSSLFSDALLRAGLFAEPLADGGLWRVTRSPAALMPAVRFVAPDAVIEASNIASSRVVQTRPGQMLAFNVAWQASGALSGSEALSARFFRADGRLAGNADVPVFAGDAVQRRRVAVPVPLDLDPGDYRMQLAAYRSSASGFDALKTDTGAASVDLFSFTVLPADAPAASTRALAAPTQADTALPAAQLLGADYDLGVPNRVRLWTHWQLQSQPLTITVMNAQGQPLAAPRMLASAVSGDTLAGAAARFQTLAFDIPPERGLTLRAGERVLSLPDFRDGERYVPFGDQMALIGLQTRSAQGIASVDLVWLAARPVTTDWVVSVRLQNAEPDGRLNAAHDGVPALGAIPALKWLAGSRIVDRHPLHVDDSSPPFRGSVLVYDSVTGVQLPVLDERYERGFEWVE